MPVPEAALVVAAADAAEAAAAVTPNTGGLDDGDDMPPEDAKPKTLPADAPNASADADFAPKLGDEPVTEPEGDEKPRATGAAAAAETAAAAAAVTAKTGPATA